MPKREDEDSDTFNPETGNLIDKFNLKYKKFRTKFENFIDH